MSKDRGPFAIESRTKVRVVRKNYGEPEREVILDLSRKDSEEQILDHVLRGITASDLNGPRSGFALNASRYRHGEAGSGGQEVDHRPRRSEDYGLHGDQGLDHSSIERYDGETDLLTNDNSQNRTEYGDFVGASAGLSSDEYNSLSQDDIWNTDVLDTFDEYQDQRTEGLPREPTYVGQPHRQLEASRSIEDEMDTLFSLETTTFSRRGL